MLHWVTDLIDNYGYAIVVVLVLAEGVGLPLPGETALITAAAFSAQSHRLSIVGVIIASFVGATAGGLGGYWMGKWGGLPFLTSHGHMIGFTNERIAKARKFFTEHGPKAVFLARFIAIVRMLAGFLAGVTNMRFEVFFLWNALGALAWSILFGALGYVFGNNVPRLEHQVGRTTLIIFGIVVVVGLFVWHHRSSRSDSTSTSKSR
jgi:membrane protein DedA with SNARE-associated domain